MQRRQHSEEISDYITCVRSRFVRSAGFPACCIAGFLTCGTSQYQERWNGCVVRELLIQLYNRLRCDVGAVARIGNLLHRRLVIGRTFVPLGCVRLVRERCRLQTCDTGDDKSALQNVLAYTRALAVWTVRRLENLRYSRLSSPRYESRRPRAVRCST